MKNKKKCHILQVLLWTTSKTHETYINTAAHRLHTGIDACMCAHTHKQTHTCCMFSQMIMTQTKWPTFSCAQKTKISWPKSGCDVLLQNCTYMRAAPIYSEVCHASVKTWKELLFKCSFLFFFKWDVLFLLVLHACIQYQSVSFCGTCCFYILYASTYST